MKNLTVVVLLSVLALMVSVPSFAQTTSAYQPFGLTQDLANYLALDKTQTKTIQHALNNLNFDYNDVVAQLASLNMQLTAMQNDTTLNSTTIGIKAGDLVRQKVDLVRGFVAEVNQANTDLIKVLNSTQQVKLAALNDQKALQSAWGLISLNSSAGYGNFIVTGWSSLSFPSTSYGAPAPAAGLADMLSTDASKLEAQYREASRKPHLVRSDVDNQ